MITIQKATRENIPLLCEIGKITFLDSHGHSATAADIDQYVRNKYNGQEFSKELSDPRNIYHIICFDGQPAGFSKIIFNTTPPGIDLKNVTKLERIYLLKDFYSKKLGYKLFQFNLELAKMNNQHGMWLFVWKENQRAFGFYKKTGFKIIGSYDFQISATHFNPNHIMLLTF